jgi:hypothetical protein
MTGKGVENKLLFVLRDWIPPHARRLMAPLLLIL